MPCWQLCSREEEEAVYRGKNIKSSNDKGNNNRRRE